MGVSEFQNSRSYRWSSSKGWQDPGFGHVRCRRSSSALLALSEPLLCEGSLPEDMAGKQHSWGGTQAAAPQPMRSLLHCAASQVDWKLLGQGS